MSLPKHHFLTSLLPYHYITSLTPLHFYYWMTAKNKAQRIKSETIHLDYISPWRSPQESGRELELLMNKHKILEEIASPKTPKAVWWHT